MGSKPRPYLENEFLRVEINPETGNIARLYDKANKREAFHGEGNSLTAWEDTAEQALKTSKEYARAGLGHRLDRQKVGYR